MYMINDYLVQFLCEWNEMMWVKCAISDKCPQMLNMLIHSTDSVNSSAVPYGNQSSTKAAQLKVV